MFIDYLALMLVILGAGLFALAYYIFRVSPEELTGNQDEAAIRRSGRWVPVFGAIGAILTITGLGIVFYWPLPGAYNIPFGDGATMIGVLFLALTLVRAKGWDLRPTAWFAFIPGLASVFYGARIVDLGMTKEPAISALGFIATGLAGLLAGPVLWMLTTDMLSPKQKLIIKVLAVLLLAGSGLVWAFNGYDAYWGHIQSFHTWKPFAMR